MKLNPVIKLAREPQKFRRLQCELEAEESEENSDSVHSDEENKVAVRDYPRAKNPVKKNLIAIIEEDEENYDNEIGSQNHDKLDSDHPDHSAAKLIREKFK